MRTLIALTLLVSTSVSQEIYKVPFASKGNTVELTVANSSSVIASQISVEATEFPSWLSYSQKTFVLEQLKGNEEKTASFSFSIDKMAPVNKEHTLVFGVRSRSGEVWTKEIKIQISPPEKFELFQNYPNPFNPTTTICYQLSSDSKVNLRVYNLLGQEIVTLVDGVEPAGYHQELFNGGRFASGTYVYRIVYTDGSGKQASARKVMTLVK
jgi:hypothetical protein